MDDASTAGVIYDIDVAIPNVDLSVLVKLASEGVVITNVSRLETSRCVKLIFKGDCIPSQVKVGRHPVRQFVQKPLQCHQCFRLRHVKGVCPHSLLCPRCAEPHAEDTCWAPVLKCSNYNSCHAASSKDCPRIKKDVAVLKQIVRKNSSHREAAETIRRRLHQTSSKKAEKRKESGPSIVTPTVSSQATKGLNSTIKSAERNLSQEE